MIFSAKISASFERFSVAVRIAPEKPERSKERYRIPLVRVTRRSSWSDEGSRELRSAGYQNPDRREFGNCRPFAAMRKAFPEGASNLRGRGSFPSRSIPLWPAPDSYAV